MNIALNENLSSCKGGEWFGAIDLKTCFHRAIETKQIKAT